MVLASLAKMPPRSVRFTKRAIDIVASAAGLCLAAPMLPLVAVAIRVDSEGPVFYRQKRACALKSMDNGIPRVAEFSIVKFRTMRVDAEKHTGAVLASQNDDRATRVGRILRRSRIDEIPQLWNVLRGDMSLVGPRPERPELFSNLVLAIPFFEERLRDVKPGLTGLAQVDLRYTGGIPKDSLLNEFKDTLHNPFDLPEAEGALADDMRIKLLYDLAYSAALERFSTFVRTELRILLKTPLVMLQGGGQ